MLSKTYWHQKNSRVFRIGYRRNLWILHPRKTDQEHIVNLVINLLDVKEMVLKVVSWKSKVKLESSGRRIIFTKDLERYRQASQESQSDTRKTTCLRSRNSSTKTKTEARTKLPFSTSLWTNGTKANFLAKCTNLTFSLTNAVKEENWMLQGIIYAIEYQLLRQIRKHLGFYFAKNRKMLSRNRLIPNKIKLCLRKEWNCLEAVQDKYKLKNSNAS